MRISPHLLFSVLLRRLRKELDKEAYILDVDTKGKRIPVFEAPAVAEMLSDKGMCDYLAEMLSSLKRTNSGIIYWKEHGAWHKRRFCDIDMDDMIELAGSFGHLLKRILKIFDGRERDRSYKRRRRGWGKDMGS